jgi:hypothetical protein
VAASPPNFKTLTPSTHNKKMIPAGNPPAAHQPPPASSSLSATIAVDPHLWLEDVLGESQLAWVERCNARCLDDVGDPRGTDCYSRIKDILDSKVREEGGFFWNS